jgi:hypothetical protein
MTMVETVQKRKKEEEGCVGDRLISSEKGNIGKPPPLL